MAVTGLNHVGLSTPDMARALAFYRDALGFTELMSFGWEAGNPAADAGLGLTDTAAQVAVLTTGTSFLEVLHFQSPTPRLLDQPPTVLREGIHRIGIAVHDLDAATDLLMNAGATYGPDLHRDRTATTRLVRDPDGNIIELLSTHAIAAVAELQPVVPHATSPDRGEPVPPTHSDVLMGIVLAGVTIADRALINFYTSAGLSEGQRIQWTTDDTLVSAAHALIGQGESTILSAGNAVVDFVQPVNPSPRRRPADARIIEWGFNHLCLDVNDIADTHREMLSQGMTCFAPWTQMPGGNSAMGYALDPAGVPIELLEHRSAQSFMWPGRLTTATQ
jgi:catechol 2,3-dioxygenase-like lactoylglutathione lyase family enzyme